MTLEISVVDEASPELVERLNALLPQLSSSAESLTIEDLERLVRSESTSLLVARDDGAIVGTLTLVIFPLPTGTRAWIEDVVVDDDARGLGAGEALTRTALDLASTRNVRTVDLTSRPSRIAAISLYEKLGFERRETNVYRFFVESPGDASQ